MMHEGERPRPEAEESPTDRSAEPGEPAAGPRHNTYAMMQRLRAERIAALRAEAGRWHGERAGGYAHLDLEIGCGHGHWLAGYAAEHPRRFCVGIDLKSRRVRLGDRKRDKRALDNLIFLKAEGREFLEAMPPEVRWDRVFLLFPDPWPKARHHKKRLVQAPFLGELWERVKPGGALYFRTDHEGYFAWAEAAVREHPGWALRTDLAWPFEQGSYFQDLMDVWQSFIAERVDMA